MILYDKRHLGLRILQLIILIFAINTVATKLYWYYTMWWFDIPMHTLGGIFLGLLFVYILFRKMGDRVDWNTKTFLYGLLFVFIVGVLWEIFEFNIDTFITFKSQNILDTLSDLCFDLTGGAIAIQYSKKYIQQIKSKIQSNSNLSDTQV